MDERAVTLNQIENLATRVKSETGSHPIEFATIRYENGGMTFSKKMAIWKPVEYKFTVQAAAGTNTYERELKIKLNGDNMLNTKTSTGILDTRIPDPIPGVSYFHKLTLSDDSANVTWSIISGALPEGLTLNASTGEISGTPE